jgi:N-acetylneuraminate synthase
LALTYDQIAAATQKNYFYPEPQSRGDTLSSKHFRKILSAKPYIIAEVGSNWITLDDCMMSIEQASLAGANAVKFQLFTNADLYGPKGNRYGHDNGKTDLEPHALDPLWLPKLAKHCERSNVDFMCTAFSIEGYNAVDPYVKAHKIASSDNTNTRLIEHVQRLGKPFFISAGGLDEEEMDKLEAILFRKDEICNLDFFTLYCNAAYPSFDHDLRKMRMLTHHFSFGDNIGLSDHSLDVLGVPVFAAKNAQVIEKHFICEQLFHRARAAAWHAADLPDAGHSLPPEDFRRMVDAIRQPFEWKPAPSEADFRHIVRPRAKAIRDMPMGAVLEIDRNYGFFRAKDATEAQANGIPASSWGTDKSPEGRTLARAVIQGETITEAHLI